jgi:hypothetical protein
MDCSVAIPVWDTHHVERSYIGVGVSVRGSGNYQATEKGRTHGGWGTGRPRATLASVCASVHSASSSQSGSVIWVCARRAANLRYPQETRRWLIWCYV